MSNSAVLIAKPRVRTGKNAEFVAWKARHDTVIGKFPGYVSSDIMPGPHGSSDWTVVINFRSADDLAAWQQSREHSEIIGEGIPLFEGGNFGEVAHVGEADVQPAGDVTEVIFSRIKPGMEDAYREWTARIEAAQARYPGYRGMFLQPPDEKGGMWTTIIRFKSAPQLEAWMNAPERKSLLQESKAFIEHEQLTRLATSFPGWVPVDPITGKGPPDWKTAMLVLLGLFPVVMLELRFLSPRLTALGLHASLATFIGNALSVAATSFITMPLFVRWLGWWLFPAAASTWAVTFKGVAILVIVFAVEVVALWRLLPW
jgi:antibiotic biosynthesis monooxygenase (ABM) superfamily enzyme